MSNAKLYRLIDQATRITMTTSSLIDHIVTNTPKKISDSGVIHTGINDHSLIFAIRKISITNKQENTIEIRNMKNSMNIILSKNFRNSTGNIYTLFCYRSNLYVGNLENIISGGSQ